MAVYVAESTVTNSEVVSNVAILGVVVVVVPVVVVGAVKTFCESTARLVMLSYQFAGAGDACLNFTKGSLAKKSYVFRVILFKDSK
jgi:hypothetical protein